jgi:hypothetical protein
MFSLLPYVIFLSVKIGENAINLSPKSVRKIGLHVYTILRTGAGKRTSANQNAHTMNFHL